jgi:hypothetical protein
MAIGLMPITRFAPQLLPREDDPLLYALYGSPASIVGMRMKVFVDSLQVGQQFPDVCKYVSGVFLLFFVHL